MKEQIIELGIPGAKEKRLGETLVYPVRPAGRGKDGWNVSERLEFNFQTNIYKVDNRLYTFKQPQLSRHIVQYSRPWFINEDGKEQFCECDACIEEHAGYDGHRFKEEVIWSLEES